ncbi:helix-turn-helix domain-containing protein [Magnetospira sp. QH-2]|uniref:helix-turn-helix domain-containing protein n=1 Tax=Magnetospira sp. (strain QH-2) TaxID=1288970 RepID=UPI0003E80E67|nr:helix-turn-helix transcriptional regulator [Magnetospira sp. QH-2]CCQ72771.1 Conserved protein of unknown function [Magnetospira sp. QH-2]
MTESLGIQLGRRLKELREARGLTQVQLAELLGKSVETISNFERGKTLPSLVTLEQVAGRLNVNILDFFEDVAIRSTDDDTLSDNAKTVRNAAELLPESDLEILVGVIGVLDSRRR